jgi:uncharacterized membrane protein
MTALLEYLGRWHIAVIHIPIGLLVTAALVEIYGSFRRFQSPTVTAVVMVFCGALGSVLAAWLGWILAGNTRHPDMEQVVEWHRWGGIASAVLAIISAWVGILALRGRTNLRWPFRTMVFITAISIGLTAHWGGELIYGEDYFALPGSAAADVNDL